MMSSPSLFILTISIDKWIDREMWIKIGPKSSLGARPAHVGINDPSVHKVMVVRYFISQVHGISYALLCNTQ